MIAIAVAWCVLLPAAHGLGSFLVRRSGDASPGDPLDRFVLENYIGVLWIAAAMLVLSFVVPLQPVGLVLIVGLAMAGATGLVRSMRSEIRGKAAIASGIVLAGVAFAMGGVVELYDSGIYHAQSIAMLREYGTITGAANLNSRMAHASTWFGLSAALEPGALAGRMSAAANGLLLALATLHLASAVWRICEGRAERHCWYLAAAYPLALYYILLETASVSPSPNVAVALSIVVAGWLLDADGRVPRAAFILLGGAAGLKLTALPGPLAAVAFTTAVARFERDWWRNWLWLGAGAVPLLAAAFITSGCPLFPTNVCLATPFTLQPEARADAVHGTFQWHRDDDGPPGSFIDLTWLPRRFFWADKPLLFTMLISMGVLLVRRRLSPAVILGAAGLAFVFATSPSFRYFIGYAAVLAGCAAASIAPASLPRLRRLNPIVWASLAVVCWLLYTTARESLLRRPVRWAERLSVPALPGNVQAGRSYFVDGIEVRTPAAGNQCWNLPFPCALKAPPAGVRACRPEAGLRGGICSR